jgi:hypothetical protein
VRGLSEELRAADGIWGQFWGQLVSGLGALSRANVQEGKYERTETKTAYASVRRCAPRRERHFRIKRPLLYH